MKSPYIKTREDHFRFNAGLFSLVVSVLLLGFKFWAFQLTHSQAIFSDAMESIVNVIAALLALFVIYAAAKPADEDHPYGHGKLEYFSAAFEGGLISFAAFFILVEAIKQFWIGTRVHDLGYGIYITSAAGFINLLLSFLLSKMGKRFHSQALRASGEHLFSDFLTSCGVVVGLFLVNQTGWIWVDSLVAIIIGLYLGWTGFKLVRQSGGALMEEKDRDLLHHLNDLFNELKRPEVIQIHHVRIIRSGRFHHIDAHVVCPEFWDIAKAHQETNIFEHEIIDRYQYGGEIVFHIDPCRRLYCEQCEVQNCLIRMKPFVQKKIFTMEELINPDEPY